MSLRRTTGQSTEPSGNEQAACPWWRLWRRHQWVGGKQYGWDGTPFSLSPIFGERECSQCGKRQRFLYDSQGGQWNTIRGGVR